MRNRTAEVLVWPRQGLLPPLRAPVAQGSLGREGRLAGAFPTCLPEPCAPSGAAAAVTRSLLLSLWTSSAIGAGFGATWEKRELEFCCH